MATFWTNFSEYSNDELGSVSSGAFVPYQGTTQQVWSTNVCAVQTGGGDIGSKSCLLTTTSTAYNYYIYPAIYVNGSSGDLEVLSRQKIATPTAATGSANGGGFIVESGNGRCLCVNYNAANDTNWARMSNTGDSAVAGVDLIEAAVPTDTYYWTRLGTTVIETVPTAYCKYWTGDFADESGASYVTFPQSTLATLWPGFRTNEKSGNGNTTIDYFAVSNEGQGTAPGPASASTPKGRMMLLGVG